MNSRRDEHGVSALELSIVAPAFLLLIFTVIQAALYFHASNVAVAAAREGAADARLFTPDEYSSGIEGKLEGKMHEYVAEVGNNSLTLDGGSAGADIRYKPGEGRVSVIVSGHSISLVPFYEWDVRRTAEAEIERFEPDLGEFGGVPAS